MRRLKLLICGTHPVQTNGYSKVVHQLAKHVSELHGTRAVDVSVYGFQRMANAGDDMVRARALPYVPIYDAAANEVPVAAGFGITEFRRFVMCTRPDVVVVFNDLNVLCGMIDQIKDLRGDALKVIAYVDQVYLSQRKDFVAAVNAHADAAIAFTPRWEMNLRRIGITLPTHFLRHGLDTTAVFPMPKALARRYLGLALDDFIVLNLNRNQPRKRWDKCMQVFAEVLSREPASKIRLVVGTDPKGTFDVHEIFERELGKWGIPVAVGMQHVLFLKSPQQMSDRDVNALYNASDVGLNTCDGEGFGLCNFEHAAVGVPQVVPAVGGFLDFFDASCAVVVEPVTTFYADASRDGVGGEAQLCDQAGFAAGILAYYRDPDLRARHGREARRRIVTDYVWRDIAAKLCDIAEEVAALLPSCERPLDSPAEQVRSLLAMDLDADIQTGALGTFVATPL